MSGKKAAAPAKGKAGASGAKGKATAAAKAARIGSRKANVKVHYKVHFYKPKTLKLARKPAYARNLPRAVAKKDKFRCVRSGGS
jgi:large subunit ribosomal protein L23Ae